VSDLHVFPFFEGDPGHSVDEIKAMHHAMKLRHRKTDENDQERVFKKTIIRINKINLLFLAKF